jgi:hypothetical protein
LLAVRHHAKPTWRESWTGKAWPANRTPFATRVAAE